MCKDLVCSRSRTYWTWSAVSTYLWQHPSGCGCGSCYGLCSCNDQRRPLWLFLSPENSSLWLDICHPSDIFPVLFPVLYVNRRSRSRPYNQHQVKYICKGGSQTLQRWCWRFEVKDEKLTKDKRFLRKEKKKNHRQRRVRSWWLIHCRRLHWHIFSHSQDVSDYNSSNQHFRKWQGLKRTKRNYKKRDTRKRNSHLSKHHKGLDKAVGRSPHPPLFCSGHSVEVDITLWQKEEKVKCDIGRLDFLKQVSHPVVLVVFTPDSAGQSQRLTAAPWNTGPEKSERFLLVFFNECLFFK